MDKASSSVALTQPPDIGSTAVLWYLHLITSTTMSCLTVSPQLKHTILAHTKSVHCYSTYVNSIALDLNVNKTYCFNSDRPVPSSHNSK